MNEQKRRTLIDQIVGGMKLGADEEIDPRDGLIHCKQCGEPRQIILPAMLGRPFLLPSCLCSCQQEAEREYRKADEQRQRMERIRHRRARGLQAQCLYDYTFANDDGTNPIMDKARAYVEHWDKAKADNTGLLLFGGVGTGKSFFAGCIANALLDRDVPVLMTNFPSLLNRMTGVFGEERSAVISELDDYDLLILDDLGVERSTEFAMEQMFQIIDGRYRCRKPMIVTTNLTLKEIKNPPDIAHERIYDRILERCAPIVFEGRRFRVENAKVTKSTAIDIVNSGMEKEQYL